MLKIYGAELSTNANKVRFTAHAIGLPFEFKPVNLMTGEQRSPEFLKVNPFGRVPAIDDNGFKLAESNTIIKYLADKNHSSLYHVDLQRRAVIDQWIDFSSLHIGMAFGKVMFNRLIYKFVNAQVDERSLKEGLGFLDQFFPLVDEQLRENTCLAGDEMTLADINLLAILDPAEVVSVDLSVYPNITRWRTNLKKQSFYTKCYESYEKMLQAMTAAMAAK